MATSSNNEPEQQQTKKEILPKKPPSFISQFKLKLKTKHIQLSQSSASQPLIKSPLTPSITTLRRPSRLSKRKLKKKLRAQILKKPIPVIQTVFIPPNQLDPIINNPNRSSEQLPINHQSQPRTLDHLPPTTHQQFISVLNHVKASIKNPSKPLLPKLNQSGSSGSYFCRYFINQPVDHSHAITPQDPNLEKIETAGIFKPKDEEPYGAMNPKWTKWAHRVFLAPLIGGFGRSCLIPNLSYLSEAAASLLDRRLQTYIVPRTEVVSISSPTFFYSWLDLRKPKLPLKPGSFQLFCQGFQDASVFFKNHPWPGIAIPDDPSNIRKKTRIFSLYRFLCGHRRNPDTDSDDEDGGSPCIDNENPSGHIPQISSTSCRDHKDWVWTLELMNDFRIEMEKLVILDYLMRNTDRGLDNFMIKVCHAPGCANPRHRKVSSVSNSTSTISQDPSLNREETKQNYRNRAHCHVAAIDNSLAFPHHHPNGWRNYAYGWLFLPASLIGQPFSQATRKHFLPLLTSQHWWAETVHELRKLFGMDPDFNVAMFERQIAVMKGQGWNIVESLKHEEEGPLELCRRQRALVWDEPVQVMREDSDLPDNFKDLVNPNATDELEGARKVQANSAPDPYSPISPMTIIPPNKRPLIQRGWSSRTSNSHKIPRRPVGLASRHLTLDGARGLDVMKQMDALEAWHTESEIEPPSYRTHSAHYQSTSRARNPTHHYHKTKQQRKEADVFDKKGDQPRLDQSLATHSRSKSDGSIVTVNEDQIGHIRKNKNKGPIRGLQIGSTSRSHKLATGTHQTGESKLIDHPEDPVVNSTNDPTNAPDDLEVDDRTDLGGDGDDEADNDFDTDSIVIGVCEQLEFVTTQPVFKNC